MTKDQHKLEPCPWCGGVGVDVVETSTFRWRVAQCKHCGAQCSEIRVQTMGDGTREEWEAKAHADAIEAWNTRAHLQQRPLPVREGTAQPLSADYDPEKDPAFYTWTWDVWVSGGNWRAEYGWEKPPKDKKRIVRNVRALFTHPAPSLPVREEPTAWRVRGYNQFKTGAPGPWRYFDGPTKPRVNIPSDCDFEPLFASSPSVQNMGEGETGKDGVKEVPRADD